MKTTIEIDDSIWRKFSVIVLQERGSRKRSEVIEELIREYVESRKHFLNPNMMEEIESYERDRDAFKKLSSKLRKKYRGKYVAIYKGEIVEIGEDKVSVAMKVYKRHGYVPVFIGYIGDERVLRVPSPRLVR